MRTERVRAPLNLSRSSSTPPPAGATSSLATHPVERNVVASLAREVLAAGDFAAARIDRRDHRTTAFSAPHDHEAGGVAGRRNAPRATGEGPAGAHATEYDALIGPHGRRRERTSWHGQAGGSQRPSRQEVRLGEWNGGGVSSDEAQNGHGFGE